ncbi:TPA: hypothetical protein ACK03L_002804 [Staphylococcus aureus]
MKLTKLQIKGLDFYKEYSNIFRDRLEMAGLDHLFIQKNTEASIPLATLNSAFEIVSGKKIILQITVPSRQMPKDLF